MTDSMIKRFAVGMALFLAILVVGSVAAQNGPGGPGGPNNPDDTPQRHAYRNGGLGFVNAGNGRGWNNREREPMGRGTGEQGVGLYTALPPATVDELPDEIVSLIIAGWADEQNAYAVYDVLLSDFPDARPFVNIQAAEAQHIAAWEFLMDRYGIAIPAFAASDIEPFASVTAACAVGAEAEIANFGLYDEMLAAFAPYPDVYMVALALRNASEFNHLPAFQRCAG